MGIATDVPTTEKYLEDVCMYVCMYCIYNRTSFVAMSLSKLSLDEIPCR